MGEGGVIYKTRGGGRRKEKGGGVMRGGGRRGRRRSQFWWTSDRNIFISAQHTERKEGRKAARRVGR